MSEALSSLVRTLCFVALLGAAWLYLVAPTLITADVADVRALISEAAKNSEAAAAVAEGLKKHPQPTESELSRLRAGVNDILLTAAAREATGDAGLLTKAEKKRMSDAAEVARRQRLESLAWSEMSGDERIQVVANQWPAIALGLLLLIIPIAFRRLTRV